MYNLKHENKTLLDTFSRSSTLTYILISRKEKRNKNLNKTKERKISKKSKTVVHINLIQFTHSYKGSLCQVCFIGLYFNRPTNTIIKSLR